MRLLSGSMMTRRDRRVADAWPGPWTGIALSGTRVRTEDAGRACAERFAREAKDLCDFPVLVIYDPPPYVAEVSDDGEPAYDAPQHVVCLWPADADPHRLLEAVTPLVEEPTSEYGFIHHFFEAVTWDKGLEELAHQADRQSEIHRVHWH